MSVARVESVSPMEEVHVQWCTTGHVVSIEDLRQQFNSCFTCGVNWAQEHVSLDCRECGGYSLERPCARCDGLCGSVWKRDLAMSHSSSKAQWEGECHHAHTHEPQATLILKSLKSLRTEEEDRLCSRLEKLAATS